MVAACREVGRGDASGMPLERYGNPRRAWRVCRWSVAAMLREAVAVGEAVAFVQFGRCEKIWRLGFLMCVDFARERARGADRRSVILIIAQKSRALARF